MKQTEPIHSLIQPAAFHAPNHPAAVVAELIQNEFMAQFGL